MMVAAQARNREIINLFKTKCGLEEPSEEVIVSSVIVLSIPSC